MVINYFSFTSIVFFTSIDIAHGNHHVCYIQSIILCSGDFCLRVCFLLAKSVRVSLLLWSAVPTLRLPMSTFFMDYLFLKAVTSSFLSFLYLDLKLTLSSTFQWSAYGTHIFVSLNAKNIFPFLSI